MQTHALEGGFQQPAMESAQAFRAVMEAMARPGTINTVKGALPPAPMSPAAGVCLLTLCDHETPVYLSDEHNLPKVREWISFHTGAPIVDAGDCLFAVGSWESLQPLEGFSQGTVEYPDRSATLIIELNELTNVGATLSGPGIKDTAVLSLPNVAPFQRNRKHYPLGLDFLFTSGDKVAALPRSSEIR